MEIESGAVFAILSAAFFAVAYILLRRATHQSDESFTALAVSLLVGTPLFIIVLPIFGEFQYLLSFTWGQYALLGAAGLLHFIITRYLYFNAVRLIGANPTAAIIRTDVIFAIILGVAFLSEPVTAPKISGAIIIMLGAVLSSIEINNTASRISTRGLMLGLGAALGVAGSAALIRMVIATTTKGVFAATFVSYLAAFIVIAFILLLRKNQRRQLLKQRRYNLIFLSSAAVFLVVGHLFRFLAFQHSPISVAQPLMGTVVIFVLIYSFIINRRIDVFNWRVILGVAMVLGGVFLINS